MSLARRNFLSKIIKELNEKVDACSREGMRVLLLGKCSGINMADMSVSGVTPSGLIVISDCIRPEARGTSLNTLPARMWRLKLSPEIIR